MIAEPADVIAMVANVFETMGVPYVLGGSWASAIHGIARATVDADFVADIKSEQVTAFVASLQGEFYLDEEAIDEAVRYRRFFNLIHLESMFKIDVFVPKRRKFDQTQIQRGRLADLSPTVAVKLASVEDSLLAKLDWFRMGGEVSEQQWRDILGILRTQASIDYDYLQSMADDLGVTDLLRKAIKQVEPLREP